MKKANVEVTIRLYWNVFEPLYLGISETSVNSTDGPDIKFSGYLPMGSYPVLTG